MKIYITDHKNESFEECKGRVAGLKKKANGKKVKETKIKFIPAPYNPFNGLS